MKKAGLLGLSLLTLLSVSSCKNPDTNPESGKTPTSISGMEKEGTKEIQFWHCIGHDKMANLQTIIDKFNEDHAKTDGYYVNAQQIAGTYDALADNVKTRLNAGYVPSITMGYPDSFAEYIGSNGPSKSKLLNLTTLMGDEASFKSEFVDQYYDEGTHYQYEGTYSVPLYKSTEVLYYNKEMFEGSQFYKDHKDEAHGSYGAKLGNPATWDWDTLTYVAGEIQKEFASVSDFHALGYDSDANLFITQMAQRNIPYTTSEGKSYEHFLFYTDKANANLVSLANEIYALTTSQALVTQASYGSYASNLFLQKKVMFTVGSTGGSAYNDPVGKSDFHDGVVPVPCYQNNKKYIMQGPSLCFFETRDTAKERAAWDFYENYVANADLNAALALDNSYDPVKKASYTSASYQRWTAMGKKSDGSDDETKPLQYRIPNVTQGMSENYITSPVFIGSGTARNQFGNILKFMKSNGGNAEKAIKDIYAACVKAVGQN